MIELSGECSTWHCYIICSLLNAAKCEWVWYELLRMVLCGQQLYISLTLITIKSNWPNSQIPECTCSISRNAPFRTEMWIFLFLMQHSGIWNRCILGFAKLVYWLFIKNRHISLSGVPDFFDRNKILSGGDLSHYQVPHCIRIFFYFVWFVFIHHNFQFYFELCTYCNILDIYLS